MIYGHVLKIWRYTKIALIGFVTAMLLSALFILAMKQFVIRFFNKMILNRVSSLDILPMGIFQKLDIHLEGNAFPNIVLLSNLVGVKLNASFGTFQRSIYLHNKLFLVLLIPILALTAGGYLTSKWSRSNKVTDILWIGIGVGILYSLYLAVLLQYSGYSSSIPLPIIKEGIVFSGSFSSREVVFHGFISGSVFSSLGAWIQQRRLQPQTTDGLNHI